MLRAADRVEELRHMHIHERNGRIDSDEKFVETDSKLNWISALRFERNNDFAACQIEAGFRNIDDLLRSVGFFDDFDGKIRLHAWHFYGGDGALRAHGRHVHSLLDFADLGSRCLFPTRTRTAEQIPSSLHPSQEKSFSSRHSTLVYTMARDQSASRRASFVAH